MADAAAGNLYDHLAGPWLKSDEFVPLQRLSWNSQTVAVAASHGRQAGNLPCPMIAFHYDAQGVATILWGNPELCDLSHYGK